MTQRSQSTEIPLVISAETAVDGWTIYEGIGDIKLPIKSHEFNSKLHDCNSGCGICDWLSKFNLPIKIMDQNNAYYLNDRRHIFVANLWRAISTAQNNFTYLLVSGLIREIHPKDHTNKRDLQRRRRSDKHYWNKQKCYTEHGIVYDFLPKKYHPHHYLKRKKHNKLSICKIRRDFFHLLVTAISFHLYPFLSYRKPKRYTSSPLNGIIPSIVKEVMSKPCNIAFALLHNTIRKKDFRLNYMHSSNGKIFLYTEKDNDIVTGLLVLMGYFHHFSHMMLLLSNKKVIYIDQTGYKIFRNENEFEQDGRYREWMKLSEIWKSKLFTPHSHCVFRFDLNTKVAKYEMRKYYFPKEMFGDHCYIHKGQIHCDGYWFAQHQNNKV